jgi:hypothetical protein
MRLSENFLRCFGISLNVYANSKVNRSEVPIN